MLCCRWLKMKDEGWVVLLKHISLHARRVARLMMTTTKMLAFEQQELEQEPEQKLAWSRLQFRMSRKIAPGIPAATTPASPWIH